MPVETLHVRLTNEQRKELEAALETPHDVRGYKRLKGVDLSSRGYPVRALAACFNGCQQSIRHYLHRYQQELSAGRGRGAARCPTLRAASHAAPRGREDEGDPDAPAAWNRLLDRRPSPLPEWEPPSHVWTLGLLARYMPSCHQVEVGQSTIDNVLTRAHFRRGRTNLTVTSRGRGAGLGPLDVRGGVVCQPAHPAREVQEAMHRSQAHADRAASAVPKGDALFVGPAPRPRVASPAAAAPPAAVPRVQ